MRTEMNRGREIRSPVLETGTAEQGEKWEG